MNKTELYSTRILLMKTVADILSHKHHGFNFIGEDAMVSDALHLLDAMNRTYLIVVNEDQEFKGIFGEHDFLHNSLVYGPDLENMKVKEVMSCQLPAVSPETPMSEVMAMMHAHHVRYVPVFSGHHFEGLITMYHIMSSLLEEGEWHAAEKEPERSPEFDHATL